MRFYSAILQEFFPILLTCTYGLDPKTKNQYELDKRALILISKIDKAVLQLI